LLLNFPPKVALSTRVTSLEGFSCRLLRKLFPEIEQRDGKDVPGSLSDVAALCGGALAGSIQYVEQQNALD
jgi:putative transposase